jgi:hypothetical protein
MKVLKTNQSSADLRNDKLPYPIEYSCLKQLPNFFVGLLFPCLRVEPDVLVNIFVYEPRFGAYVHHLLL